MAAGLGDRVAIHWEGEPGDTRTITYADLLTMTSQAANTLTELGVSAGDRVAIYMPMIPEAAFAMLACARIGAVHSVVFGGFSPDSLANRLVDCDSNILITADEGLRGGKPVWQDVVKADRTLWQTLGEIGEACGLEWAGRWTGELRELGHFQFTAGLCLVDLQAGQCPPDTLPSHLPQVEDLPAHLRVRLT